MISDILFITICAAICGADGWEDIEEFAHAKEAWLKRHLDLPNGLPSDDTFRRVISRIEVRRCWAVGDVQWLRHQDRWAGLRSIVAVEARRIVGAEESLERRYYITSLAPEAADLLAAVREQWGIENQVHWVLDVSFSEDRSRTRTGRR